MVMTLGSDCIRIFGLCVERLNAPAMRDKSRAGSQSLNSDLATVRLAIGFPLAPVRAGRHHHRVCSSARGARPVVSPISSYSAGALTYAVLCHHTAQTIRASLLASATAALLWPRCRSRPNAHARNRSGGGALFRLAWQS